MPTIVGVLRGGPSREHEISLKTGASILANLPSDQYQTRDIYIDKRGQWYERGRAITPDKVLQQVDVVLNGLHGEYGEDGQAQRVLEDFGVRYTGSDALSAHQSLHKILAKQRAKEAGLLTPDFYLIERPEDVASTTREVMRKFLQPVVVKPVGWGSSIGVSIVGGHIFVLRAIEDLFAQGAQGVLVEEYIRGKEVSAGVVEGLRGEKLYALPTVEVATDRMISPGRLSRVETEDIKRAAKVAHRALGLRHYSQSDFIISPRGIFYLETDSLPSLTEDAPTPTSLAAVGVSMPDFLSHLIHLARS
jgi:D-alanine-D-alanine ligase